MQPSWLYLAIVLLLQILISDGQSAETSDEKQEIQTLDTENNDTKANPIILVALLSAGICIILCFCIYIIRHRWNSADQKDLEMDLSTLPNNPRSDDTLENEKDDKKDVESSPLVQKTKTQMIVDAGDEDLHKFKSIVRFALNVDSSDMYKMNSADHDNEQLELILNDMTPSNAKVNDMKSNNYQNMDSDQSDDKMSNRYRNDSMLSDDAHSMI